MTTINALYLRMGAYDSDFKERGTMKRVKIDSRDKAEALMVFLLKECQRHQKDIDGAARDVVTLSEKWNLEIPESVEDVWYEV